MTRFFLLRPVFGIVLAALMIISGALAYSSMVRENYPDLAIPQATVSVVWAGAAPSQLEKEVVASLEAEIRALADVRAYRSSAQSSYALIAVEFDADAALADAMSRLRAAVAAGAARLPRAAERPVIEQVSVNDLPIMTVAVVGGADQLSLERAAEQARRALQTVDGVRKIEAQGARGEAVYVLLDPVRMRALGLAATDVRDAIRAANQDLSWGRFEDATGTLPLYLEGRFTTLEDIERLTVGRRGLGDPVRLREVATVRQGLGPAEGDTRVSVGGGEFERAVTLSVQRRPGADTIATIARVRHRLAAIAAAPDWPPGVRLIVASDEGEIIEASFDDVQSNLAQGVAAVFAVLLLALTWRAASVAALALPLTLLGALAALGIFGFTLNTLVMLGMVIALGILVDVFILVMEGVHEGVSVRGESWEAAAVATARSFFLPAVAGQATTILAMVPLMLIGGVDGKFIQMIPLTAIACLMISLIVAFAICIPLSRVVMAPSGASHAPTRVDRLTERAAGALCRWLARGPVRGRGAAAATVGLATLAFGAALVAADGLEQIVYPKEDRRSLGVTAELRPDATLEDAGRVAETLGDALRQRPEFSSVFVHAGELSPYALPMLADYLTPLSGAHLVGATVRFEAREARDRLAFEYLPEIRAALDAALAEEPGVTVRLTPDLGGATATPPIAIAVYGDDLRALRRAADDVRAALASLPGVRDLRDTLGPFQTEARFDADPEALSFFGVDEGDLLEQVRLAMQADKIGSFARPGAAPDLDLRLGTGFASRDGAVGGPRAIHEFETISIVDHAGRTTPLASLVDLRFVQTPAAILRDGGRRSVTITANLADGATAAAVMAAATPRLERLASDWPDGFSLSVGGETAAADETFEDAGRAFALALCLVFAVLALLFQSFRQPLIIMAMAPLSLTGVFLGFAALDIPISFAAMIGVIALIGIVVNDAIVMVDVMNARRDEGLDPIEAARRGAAERLRPILTTSITTIVGLTPLALSSPAWYPLCMAVILGLGVATVLALVVIPALYVLTAGPTAPRRAASAVEAATGAPGNA